MNILCKQYIIFFETVFLVSLNPLGGMIAPKAYFTSQSVMDDDWIL